MTSYKRYRRFQNLKGGETEKSFHFLVPLMDRRVASRYIQQKYKNKKIIRIVEEVSTSLSVAT